MLDFIYHMKLTLFCYRAIDVKKSLDFAIYTRVTLLRASFQNVTKICKPLVVYGS